MGVSFTEIRKVCQQPVADGNDVAGLLFGDRLSLPITKLLLDLHLSPSIATVGMLVCGLVGSGLQFGGPGLAAAGALLLLLYYILDCVDGEVARWRRIEHARWGYYEYIFHFLVKPTAFLCVGFALWSGTGSMIPVVAGVSAAVATLWLKLFLAVPSIVFTGAVLGRGASGTRPYREYVPGARDRARRLAGEQAAAARAGGEHAAGERAVRERAGGARAGERTGAEWAAGGRLAEGAAMRPREEVFRLRLDRVTLRALATNFDVGLLLLVLATAGDLALEPFPLLGVEGWSLRGLWLLYYGLVLPFDFIDYVRSYFQRGHFDQQMVRLLARAHGFRLPERDPPADDESSDDG